ncbi:putative leucine-rich repeat-containing protein DDB_G0290503 isoform X2 [Ceratina calcarata]|uniref:Leucine-rich repeat-containing protein DDB_G0290503 isoform X2 n=1 Tax=Ceratina calcarata TaxID=156304 RepID=A0AAJ7SDA6_9HYME|nr:putative leucine-rich repeat-containing protein DDB_G0290503 isoform X2 [Ceratina calcarata]
MYQVRSGEDAFEPRILPKPSSRIDDFIVPSVPDVSLIFDKPLHSKTPQHVGINSPLVESRSSTHKSNSPLNVNGSYAAWREQNYARKPSSPTVNNSTSPQVQFNQDYVSLNHSREDNTMHTSKQSKGKNCTMRRDSYNDSQREQEVSRRNADLSNKYNPEDNTTRIESNQSARAQCSDKMRRDFYLPTMSHVPKQCMNTGNYIVNENEYSPLLYERTLATQDSNQQKVSYNNSINDPSIQTLPMNPNSFQRNEIQLPHYLGQQYPSFNMNRYPFPQLHPYAVSNTDNQETVKNLLQIINSQNEQIKSLQTQVDRLLKMQEENMRERKSCSCSSQSRYSTQLHTNVKPSDIVDVPNCVNLSETVKNDAYQRELPIDRRKENFIENESTNQNELILTDVQSKKAFVEQKVSIGVMTSFEFTVQNNPYAIDVEDYKENDDKQDTAKACHNIRDTNESLRRYKNSFTRMSSAQLENIVEDSESYMSSSQQQSSNLNASTSVKDLERPAYVDNRRDLDNRKSESPKLGKGATKLNETESNMRKHLGKEEEIERRRSVETTKTPMMQRNSEYVSENRNFKPNTCNGNEYRKINVQRDNDSVKSSNSLNNSGCYKDHRKEGQISGSKRSNCIEDSLILNGADLRITERPPLTPEPSIHVEMNEYSSDEDSEKVKRSSKVGWTFYNNVLGQVNQLLQNSTVAEDQQQNPMKVNHNERNETENKAALDTVKVATLEQLKKLGISLRWHSTYHSTRVWIIKQT